MSASMPWSSAPTAPSSNDPNELLRHIDQTTTHVYHWIRLGFVVVIVLLLLVALGF